MIKLIRYIPGKIKINECEIYTFIPRFFLIC